MPSGPGSVAIVHDYLNQFGGAERVVLAMRRIWPQATVYTSLYRPESTFPEFRHVRIETSALNRLPVDKRFRALLPLYPAAFRSLPVEEELVIVSSSGWAHHVHPPQSSSMVVYCHNPARWLYQPDAYLGRSLRRLALSPALALLRRADRHAARGPDVYVANSATVRDRVRQVYGRTAEVVHPPVEVDRFVPSGRGERMLVISRLLDYKRVDLAIDAANQLGMGLDVVGDGPARAALEERAGDTVTFHGRLEDGELRSLLQSCRTVCVPAAEDFGIVAVEAHAAGKPVVAYAGGGALEVVEEGQNGSLFRRPVVEDLVAAVRRVERIDASPQDIARSAQRFSPEAFARSFRAVADHALAARMASEEQLRHSG